MEGQCHWLHSKSKNGIVKATKIFVCMDSVSIINACVTKDTMGMNAAFRHPVQHSKQMVG